MKYKIEFNYRYGKDYVYCSEYCDTRDSMAARKDELYLLVG